MIGTPSIFKMIRKDATLTRVLPTFVFRVDENAARRKWNSPLVDFERRTPEVGKNGQFPDEPVRTVV